MKHTRILLLVALLAAAAVGSSRLDTATITVTNTNDNGTGSLRQALADATDGDTINFNPSLDGRTITLTSGELLVDKNVTINGSGADTLVVDANHASRVFYIASGTNVTISGLTITNGSAPRPQFGGGIYNDHATLTLSGCTISGNAANQGVGGGIFNDQATLTVLNSTVSGNSAASGGGIYSEGQPEGSATLELVNSTLSGNWATFGGAIYASSDAFNSARLYLFHTTFSGNSATSSGGGGGIYNAGAITQFANTVFNASSIFRASGMIRSLGHNLCSDDGSGFLTATGDQINIDPMLGPLQDNGGPTFTHMLLSGSPAIDSGDSRFDPYSFGPPLLHDQRGDGFARVVKDRIDIGAFEVQPAPPPTPTPKATAKPTSKAKRTSERTAPASGASIVSAALASMTLNPATLTGGANSTGTVTLSAAAPAGGAVVALTSNKTNVATVPDSVMVPAGATTATFKVATKTLTVGTVAIITATYDGVSKGVGLVVNPLLGSLTLKPSVLIGGADCTGTVTLTSAAPAGGAVVTLKSGNTNAATVPASVTVAAGTTSATFLVTTKTVTAVTQVNITATSVGASRIVTLTLNPAGPAGLVGVSVNPAAVTGPAGSTGTVTLGAPAPAGGAVVTLSSNLIAATVPATVTVPANATTVTFLIATKQVTAVRTVTIKATYNGVNKTATLTVNPPAAGLVGVSVNPAAVTGPAGSTGTVTLGAAAPAGGAVVMLASNNPNAATVPVSVTVPANATTVTFLIATKQVTAMKTVTITATYNGVNKTATLTVNPAVGPATLAGVAVNPATMIFGSTSTGTVTLTAPAPAGGAVIALSSSEIACFYLPASVTIPAGATTAQFTVTSAVARATTEIKAIYNGVERSAALTSVYATVTALTCTPNPVIGGNPTVCTVTLNGTMVEDISVYVSSDQLFYLPNSSGYVKVPAGAVSAAFSLPTTIVPRQIIAHISANVVNYVTDTVTAPLTINLTNRGRKWNLNNVVFKDGGTANGYFVYDPATREYLAANIQVTPGIPPDPTSPLGQDTQQFYYYPSPSDQPTFVNNSSMASLMALQNPVTSGLGVPNSWTLLQFNFAQPLTNADATIPLLINPNGPYTPYCDNTPRNPCAPPQTNISQELFALPENEFNVHPAWYYRVIVSGSVTTQ